MSTQKSKLSRDALEKVAEVFKLFGDATRLAILQEVREQPQTVSHLVEELGTSQANISKHLRVLHEGGLLRREKEGQHVYYSVDDEIIFPLCELVCGKLKRDAENAQMTSFEI